MGSVHGFGKPQQEVTVTYLKMKILPTNRIEPNKIVHQNIYTTTEIKQEFNKLSSNNKGKASLYFFNPGEKQYNVEKHTSYKHYHTT